MGQEVGDGGEGITQTWLLKDHSGRCVEIGLKGKSGAGQLGWESSEMSREELMIMDIVVVISIMEQWCGKLKVYSEHL